LGLFPELMPNTRVVPLVLRRPCYRATSPEFSVHSVIPFLLMVKPERPLTRMCLARRGSKSAPLFQALGARPAFGSYGLLPKSPTVRLARHYRPGFFPFGFFSLFYFTPFHHFFPDLCFFFGFSQPGWLPRDPLRIEGLGPCSAPHHIFPIFSAQLLRLNPPTLFA